MIGLRELKPSKIKLLYEHKKQGNRVDMRKIHVTRQFFEASGRNGDLIEKSRFR